MVFSLEVDGVLLPQMVSMPRTANIEVFTTASVDGIYLTAGEHVVKVSIARPATKLDWISFAPQATLAVSRAGDGQGTVSGAAGKISCGTTCEAGFALGSQVTLSATPATGSSFAGWSGACANGDGDCVVSLAESQSVTATFTLNRYPVELSFAGAGSGELSITAGAGITSCSAGCSLDLAYGTVVQIHATTTDGLFAGWDGGACADRGSICEFTVDGPLAATATFETYYSFKVVKQGLGSGLVYDTNFGSRAISCGEDCEESGWNGTQYELLAEAHEGSSLVGWSGDCVVSGDRCAFTLDHSRILTVTYSTNVYDLAVTVAGSSSGSATSDLGGISCAGPPQTGSCSTSLPHGTKVTLAAKPQSGAMLEGWSGACHTTYECVIELKEAASVTATFAPCSPGTLVTNGNDRGPGSLRQALAGVCPEGTVSFAGNLTIELESHIEITRGLTIDGGTHAITISGALNGDPSVQGGVFYVDAGRPVTLKNLAIVDGTAVRGGGVYARSTLVVQNSRLSGNRALNDGNFSDGGGIYANAPLALLNSSVSGNSAQSDGGGAAVLWDSTAALVSGSTFTQNSAGSSGGGLFQVNEGSVAIVDSTFTQNSAESGGGIGQNRGDLQISGSTFSQNSAAMEGGGLFLYGYSAAISNTVVSDNEAYFGGGIRSYLSQPSSLYASSMLNNSATDSGGGLVVSGDEPLQVGASLLVGNSAGGHGDEQPRRHQLWSRLPGAAG